MSVTLDQLAASLQLDYQVITQRIDNLYLNLNSANNQQTNTINTLLNNAVNNIGSVVYLRTNNVTNALNAKLDSTNQIVSSKIDSATIKTFNKIDESKVQLQQKLDKSLADTLADIDARNAQTFASMQHFYDNLLHRVESQDAANQAFQLQIEGNLDRAIDASVLHSKENTDRLQGAINTVIETQASDIKAKIGGVSASIAGLGAGIGGDNSVLLQALENLYSPNNNPNQPQVSDTFWTALIRIISGNPTADAFNALDTADITGNLFDQITKIGTIEENALNGKYKTIDDVKNAFKGIGVDNSLVGSLVQLLFAIANIGDLVKTFGKPVITKTDQLVTSLYSLKQLSEEDLLTAFIRNTMPPTEVKKNLDNLGHSPEDSDLLMKNAVPKYSIQELFRLGYLGKFNGQDVKTHMRELGWNDIDTILHGYLNQPRPGIQDLITFAVKEVYSPEVYQKFGQYQDFPKVFGEQAKLLGLDEDYAKQYWAAHWALPGTQQGFDLFHRGLITHEDLTTLLAALDVMPFWRDKLINLSYNLIGRIDARRLYGEGIWDEPRLLKAYIDEGYSPQDAKDLVAFTIKHDNDTKEAHKTAVQKEAHNTYIKAYLYGLADHNTTKDKLAGLGYDLDAIDLELNIAKYNQFVDEHKPKGQEHGARLVSLSLSSYRSKALDRNTVLDTLKAQGYSEQEANTELQLADQEQQIAFRQTVIKEIERLYADSLLSDNDALTKLVGLGFANGEALNIIAQLQILKGLDDKKPTPAQFKTMFENGLITQTEYEIELSNLGYNAEYIPLLVKLSTG